VHLRSLQVVVNSSRYQQKKCGLYLSSGRQRSGGDKDKGEVGCRPSFVGSEIYALRRFQREIYALRRFHCKIYALRRFHCKIYALRRFQCEIYAVHIR
jgi:hypothetical protein